MKLLLLLFSFLFLNASDVAFKNNNIILSEETSQSCAVPFKELLVEGLGSHPSIAMSKEVIKGAEFQVDTATWGYFPSPSVEYSYRDQERSQATARLDQPLWTGGKLDSAHDKALAKKSEADHSYNENQYKLIEDYLDTLQAYIQAEHKIAVLNENKRQFNTLLKMLNRMMAAGIASQTDKDLLHSRLSRINSDLVVTKAKLNVARIQFEILTNRPIECRISYKYEKVFTSKIEIETLIQDILDFHPSLKIIDARVDSAASEVDSKKANLWPSVILRGEYRSSGGLYKDGIIPTDEALVYATFSYAPGSGLSVLSSIDEAKVNVVKTKYDKKVKEKDLIDDLMNNYISYLTAVSEVKISAANITTLEKIYASNKRLYLLQKKQWLDLVNSLSDLNLQKISYSRQAVESKVFEWKIALKTGKIDLNNGDVLDGI